jgi:hypothetical protein
MACPISVARRIVTISAFSGDGANVRRLVPLMKTKGSSRGEPHLPDFLKDAPELWALARDKWFDLYPGRAAIGFIIPT